MSLITPEYLELQKKLHATGNYGKGVDAEECANVIRGLAPHGSSVLDYGCGQGHLGRLLSPDYDVREYDPCIPGKDGKPEAADFVVCADVLEHIEPELVETVVNHLRSLAKKRLVIVIATRESKKFLEDGRNVHLSVHDSDWWKKKFDFLFRLERWEDRHEEGKGIFAILEPATPMGELRAIGVMKDELRNQNTAKNIGLTWKRINNSPAPNNGKTLIICGYGPSIGYSWRDIESQRSQYKAEVVSVSGCHDFLRKKGIKPTWHVECDPRPHKSELMGKTRKGVKYLMASCCDPGFLKRIVDEGGDLILWHLFNGEETFKVRTEHVTEAHQALIPGGGSVLLRALVLFYFMGYRNYIVHGFDCSFADTGETHAGPHTAAPFKQHIKIRCETSEKWFDTAPVMVTYARHMLKDLIKGRFPGCNFAFCGDGLFQTMLRASLSEINQGPQKPTRDYFHLTEEDVEPHEIFGKPPEKVA